MSDDVEPIPARSLPLAVRAPGKCILFGEHAVVHGGPELVAAIDLHVQVGIRSASETTLNGSAEAPLENAYLREGLARLWSGGPPIALSVTSRIPRSAGLGSSAAFCAALVAALGALSGGIERRTLAERAFEVEHSAQGVGSPGDTSTVSAGGIIAVNGGSGRALWEVSEAERRWTVRRVPDPGWTWVVGYSGIPRSTGDAVRAFARRVSEPDGARLLERFRDIALAGIDALREEDPEAVGRAMSENHGLLREAGVSHPRLEALLEATAPASYGAKLTGAGVGGSIVALPRPGRETELVRRIARAGGVPFAVRIDGAGARLVDRPSERRPGSLPSDDPDDRPAR